MKRAIAVVALVAVVSLLSASEVRGGAGALVQPIKTTGPAVSATIVVRVPGGLTTVRVQKGNNSRAALFTDTRTLSQACITSGFGTNLDLSTIDRYVGFMTGWVPTYSPDPKLLGDLVGGFGPTQQAVITDIDNVACTDLANGEHVLSLTATIQFATSPVFPAP